jgi:putative transcriptional regulator
MINAHAPGKILSAYADGTLSPGMSILVASHLTFCSDCRSVLSRFEDVGGAALVLSDPVEPDGSCLDEVISRIEFQGISEDLPAPRKELHDFIDDALAFPAPLHDCIGAQPSGLRWRFRMPGLSEMGLAGFEGEEINILRARPGVRIPAHTHSGQEATLILAGAMRDGETILRRGDVAFADHHDDHRPEIVGSEVCYCLTVVTGKLRFTGPLGKALNLLNG